MHFTRSDSRSPFHEALSLGFQLPEYRPDLESQSLSPPKSSILPALDCFQFSGVIDYLLDFVTFINAPQLKGFYITSINQIDFDTPQLARFISRTPKLYHRIAHVQRIS